MNVGASVQGAVLVTEKGILKGWSLCRLMIELVGIPALNTIDVKVHLTVNWKVFDIGAMLGKSERDTDIVTVNGPPSSE